MYEELSWRKSSHSGSGDQCVEVAAMADGLRAVRDSKNPAAPAIVFSVTGFAAFLQGLHE